MLQPADVSFILFLVLGRSYLDQIKCLLQLANITCDDYDTCPPLRKLHCNTPAHALGGACNKDGLVIVSEAVKRGNGFTPYLAIDIELILAKQTHDGRY